MILLVSIGNKQEGVHFIGVSIIFVSPITKDRPGSNRVINYEWGLLFRLYFAVAPRHGCQSGAAFVAIPLQKLTTIIGKVHLHQSTLRMLPKMAKPVAHQ